MALANQDPPPKPTESGTEEVTGLQALLASFSQDALAYLELRGKLFGVEAKEAGQVYGRKGRFIVAGVISLALGYLTLLAAGIGLIGDGLDPLAQISLKNWIGGALILAAVHLLLGMILLRRGVKFKAPKGLFKYTRHEFTKEQEWLKQKKKL